MQMRHSFSGVLTVIDHEAEALAAIFDAELVGDLSGSEQQCSKRGLIFCHRLTNTRDDFLRHNQHMDRSLCVDVVEGGDEVVLIDERRGDLAVDDLLKNGFFRHGVSRRVLLESCHAGGGCRGI